MIAVSLAFVAGVPTSGLAKDFCVQLGAPTNATVVLKNFRVPGKGQCTPLAGWMVNSPFKDTVSGTACTFSNAKEVRFGFRTSPYFDFSGPFIDPGFHESNMSVGLAIPGLTGSFISRGLVYNTEFMGVAVGDATGGPCSLPIVPFP